MPKPLMSRRLVVAVSADRTSIALPPQETDLSENWETTSSFSGETDLECPELVCLGAGARAATKRPPMSTTSTPREAGLGTHNINSVAPRHADGADACEIPLQDMAFVEADVFATWKLTRLGASCRARRADPAS